MSLKAKIGTVAAVLVFAGAAGAAPASASTRGEIQTTIQTTIGAVKSCATGTGTLQSKISCAVASVKPAVQSIVNIVKAKIPSLSSLISQVTSKLGGGSLSSLIGQITSKLGGLNLGGLNLGALGL